MAVPTIVFGGSEGLPHKAIHTVIPTLNVEPVYQLPADMHRDPVKEEVVQDDMPPAEAPRPATVSSTPRLKSAVKSSGIVETVEKGAEDVVTFVEEKASELERGVANGLKTAENFVKKEAAAVKEAFEENVEHQVEDENNSSW